MTEYLLHRPQYPLWEYEQAMAKREISALTGLVPQPGPAGWQVTSDSQLDEKLLRQLVFTHQVTVRDDTQPHDFLTNQARLENSTKIARQAKMPGQIVDYLWQFKHVPSGRRESRYITHGIH